MCVCVCVCCVCARARSRKGAHANWSGAGATDRAGVIGRVRRAGWRAGERAERRLGAGRGGAGRRGGQWGDGRDLYGGGEALARGHVQRRPPQEVLRLQVAAHLPRHRRGRNAQPTRATATVFNTDIEICLDITILSMIFILIAGRKHLHQPLAGVEVALPRGIVQRSALPHVLQQARTRVGYQLLKSLVDDIQMRLYATTPLRNHQV